jgi:hypothetical protein
VWCRFACGLCLVFLSVGCKDQAAPPGPAATAAASAKPTIGALRVSKGGTFLGTVTFATNNGPSLKLEAGVEGPDADKLKKRIEAVASARSVAADTEVHYPNGDRDYGTVATPMHHADFREMLVRNLHDAHFDVKRLPPP